MIRRVFFDNLINFEFDDRKVKTQMEPDYQSEIAFWAETLPEGRRDPWMINVIDPETRIREFPPELLKYVEALNGNFLQVLDVGAGPLSPLAWGVDNGLFEVTATDPLAEEYARLMADLKIDYPIAPIKGFGEHIADMFEPGRFDIVYSRNALDHTVSPGECIENITRVLKPGGIFFQEGFFNEGTEAGWTGLHQHDLFPENGHLWRADKHGTRTNLTENLNLACVLEKHCQYYGRNWYNIILKKSADDVSIRAGNLTKIYKLYDTPKDRVREALHPFRKKYHRPFHALDDVSFEVKKGETIGIIGRNGSGKSTLLQIICGVLHPTSGGVDVNGRVSALLELGTGFNPEFTGRENVYLNSSILGLTKAETDARFERIERFADIGDFIDQPVKTYSSGMYIRLAFSVAINVDPDILVVDEALSVGDIFFQHKCMTRMRQLMKQGVTIVFVTHDMGAVKSLCGEAILLRRGKVAATGRAEDVVNEYVHQMLEEDFGSNGNSENAAEGDRRGSDTGILKNSLLFGKNPAFLERTRDFRTGSGEVKIQNVELLDEKGDRIEACLFKDKLVVRIHLEFFIDCHNPNIGFLVRDKNGVEIIGTNLFQEDISVGSVKKGETLVVDFKFKNILQNGNYSIAPAVCQSDDLGRYSVEMYDLVDNAAVFASGSKDGKAIHTKVSVPFEITVYQ